VTTEITYEPVVGLEVHAQLRTRSKMFCGCPADYSGAPPNTHCCPVCLGMPGSLPVINSRALEFGLITALALHSRIAPESKFDRKNYSYPDIPKGYQISQYDEPIGTGGWLEYESGDRTLRWDIRRVHLEEDTGKSLHTSVDGREVSLVDYNRAGVPLMEIVTEPAARTPAEARDFFEALRRVLMYLGVNDGNLQEGSMRADINVSLRLPGGEPGTKVEIKNLNSFRAVQRALEYEIERQSGLLRSGQRVEQETRGWSETVEITVGQRSKEYAHDYRYFPEPDLPPLRIADHELDRLRRSIPELPLARLERFRSQLDLTPLHAEVLSRDRNLADFFEGAVTAAAAASARSIANWMTGDVLRLLGERDETVDTGRVTPPQIAELVDLVERGEISTPAAKQTLEHMFDSGEAAASIVDRLGLRQVTDVDAVESLVLEVIAANPTLVDTYRAGKTNVIKRLMGEAMKASRGTANPETVMRVLEERLSST
jgi:aspartyl-tRNA(Asn)/glutamyl-tRNA(Gln) amidotransferase subunit B